MLVVACSRSIRRNLNTFRGRSWCDVDGLTCLLLSMDWAPQPAVSLPSADIIHTRHMPTYHVYCAYRKLWASGGPAGLIRFPRAPPQGLNGEEGRSPTYKNGTGGCPVIFSVLLGLPSGCFCSPTGPSPPPPPCREYRCVVVCTSAAWLPFLDPKTWSFKIARSSIIYTGTWCSK